MHEADLAALGNPNYMGMLDQVIASQGRVFVGTWYEYRAISTH